MRGREVAVALGLAMILSALSSARAQQSVNDWAAALNEGYLVYPDQQYSYSSAVALKLDVWQAQTKEPVPTLIYYHGGGWFFGDRTGALPYLMPWLARGWNVVNVEYRMSGTALAPAAVEDARCALRWVYRNAEHYHLDTKRIVVTGHSAGGHLALMAGMLTESDGLDENCPADASSEPPLKVAAVIDWYGPTDLNDIIAGANKKTYAQAWLGTQLNKSVQAERVSPIRHVHPGLPPILLLHGDDDPTVPYQQSVRLHKLLDDAHQINELYTIHGGRHGMFGEAEDVKAYKEVWRFLKQYAGIDVQLNAAH